MFRDNSIARERFPEVDGRTSFTFEEIENEVQCGTAKMGRDAMSVVDVKLKVYSVDGLRIADASILPRVTTGNTMAPCVVIGERAADVLRTDRKL